MRIDERIEKYLNEGRDPYVWQEWKGDPDFPMEVITVSKAAFNTLLGAYGKNLKKGKSGDYEGKDDNSIVGIDQSFNGKGEWDVYVKKGNKKLKDEISKIIGK